MSMQVNNNIPAFNVFASLSQNMVSMKKSMGRLSTGVISVGDDPSGVGISERMRSQIRSTAMARRNVDNGVSMIQTADSWLQKINDILGRMHELAVEAKDGTKNNADITNIQTEFGQLQSEISRITSRSTAAAKFNGLYLFRGGTGNAVASGDTIEAGNVTIQIGADNGQAIDLTLADLQITNSTTIGTTISYTYSNNSVASMITCAVSWKDVVDGTLSVGTSNALGKLQVAIDHISNARSDFGAQQNRLEHTRSGLLAYEDNLRSAESKIRDVDVAKESTEFAKNQILNQIGTAMLTQANQLPAGAVQLLGG